jgi:hypothetical protein
VVHLRGVPVTDPEPQTLLFYLQEPNKPKLALRAGKLRQKLRWISYIARARHRDPSSKGSDAQPKGKDGAQTENAESESTTSEGLRHRGRPQPDSATRNDAAGAKTPDKSTPRHPLASKTPRNRSSSLATHSSAKKQSATKPKQSGYRLY